MTLGDLKFSSLKVLIPKTLADGMHVSICLNIFLIVWHGLEWIDPSINGIWFGLLAAALVASGKELNDQFGWFKFLLSDGKTKTGFDGRDWWMGVLPVLIITIINYLMYR